MRTINLAQAKAGLSALLDAVEAGEEVVIIRRGRPVAQGIWESRGGRIYLDACKPAMAYTWPWPIATTSSAANP
jgi:antitoxin (DNA-binding transcriptional repressor) of toxin-antitoxin stability system